MRPDDVFIVEDARQDVRFADHPLVTGAPNVTFYAGAPLVEPGGMPLGTLCVIDTTPRQMTPDQVEALRTLARQVVSQLELRRTCLELRDVADKLGCANRELEDFTHVAAHDLQEPLRKIVSFGELLREDLGDDLPPAAAEDLGYMTDAAVRMRALIQDLLKLSRAGTAKLVRERLDLQQCVDAALSALSMRIADTGAEIIVDELPQVAGDATLLTQLFQNLIGNALKFVRDKVPRVHVTCEEIAGETVLGVRDNGIGIDTGSVTEIFGAFKRLNSTQEFEGSGVGLSIVRKAVERHGGRVWVESQPGLGSHFKVVLPEVTSPRARVAV